MKTPHTSTVRRILSSGVTLLVVSAGLTVVAAAPAAAQGQSACLPALNQTFLTGDFTANTSGSGVGDVSTESEGAPDVEVTGRLTWSARQSVTGNTGGGAGTMTGTLSAVVNPGSISFVSTCILEVGVFSGSTEDDPFDPGTTRSVIRGIEGEWMGTAQNYPTAGQSTLVVASLAVWTTDAGPRYHFDITPASDTPGACPTEGSSSFSAGGPTGSNGGIAVSAPDQHSGLGACAF